MVQRKVANNKLGTHVYDSTLKIDKRQGNTKTSLQNYDYKTKGADLKVKRMKKSRSIKRSDVQISLRSLPKSHKGPRQPGEPPPLVTPIPKKPSSTPCKTPCSYPNYMKSTSSSEARKEKNSKVSRVSSILKTSTKTSSLEKVRTLTKSPSFKHTRTSTCSSTLKDSKFPAYLELKPGATEAEGNSLFRVCPYNYCSLNGHHHKSAPPLKRFLSSRRRVLKGNKVSRPEVLSPRKGKHSECVIRKAADQDDNFFVEIYVPDKEVATQVSESLSDGPCSDIDFQYDDQCEDSSFSDLNIINKGYSLTSIPNQSSFKKDLEEESLSGVGLDEFRENLDIEWEEGQIHIVNDDGKILIECDDTNDQNTPGFEIRKSFSGYLEEFDNYPSFSHDEIVEFACFSDADSSDDNDSTQIGEKEMEQPDMAEENKEIDSLPDNEVAEDNFILANEATIDAPMLEYESTDEHDGISSDLIKEITEVQYGDLDSYQESFVSGSDVATEDDVTGEILKEENVAEFVMEEMEANEEMSKVPEIAKNLETSGLKGGSCNANDDNQGGTDQSEGVTCVSKSTPKSGGGSDSDEIKLRSIQDNVEAEPSEMENYNAIEAAEASPAAINKKQNASKNTSNNGLSDFNQDLVNSCNRIKRGMRWKKADVDVENEREFNPRGPNFLDIEPDPEAEKVDLKHQEMDARRNAEEWMLDYALQKTLNQLAPARKKKVALLVEAFDAVLPEHKNEFRRNSANFPYVKSIQACS